MFFGLWESVSLPIQAPTGVLPLRRSLIKRRTAGAADPLIPLSLTLLNRLTATSAPALCLLLLLLSSLRCVIIPSIR